MFAIFKRDLRAFYTTPIGYAFSGVVILIMNLCFYYMNVETSSSDVKRIFYWLLLGLAFLAPILTMRLLSEEKKTKTDQLLYTVPLRITDIVLGKYLAALCVFLISLVGTFMIPVILSMFSVAEYWAILGNYVAIVFAASAFIAIGLFVSSTSENQLVSALVSWAILVGLWLVDTLVANVEIRFIRVIVDWVSVFARYESFTYGLFDLSDILYYFSITAVFLFLTVRMLDKRRYA
ncbi:MAG: ABC transporter permease subunit [Oscillospiraceae bacterium]|jgi:ABC-2 type transport system permease protein|nr:ABC transporter permease subunit [Oscillospiraceae bacterium]